jgi:hypothetical protein
VWLSWGATCLSVGAAWHGLVQRDLVGVRRGLVEVRRDLVGVRHGLVGMRRSLAGVRCKIRKNKLKMSAGKRHHLKEYFFNEL